MPHKDEPRAFPRPCITIYGGREPVTFTAYNQTHALHTNGSFHCCEYGGCWQSRVVPLAKDDNNTRMCHATVVRDGRTIPECMDLITPEDIIRIIERHYAGNIRAYRYDNPVTHPITYPNKFDPSKDKIIHIQPNGSGKEIVKKEINILASLQSKGGGERSALFIAKLLRDAGWKVHFYPWGKVHKTFEKEPVENCSFIDKKESLSNGLKIPENKMIDHIKEGIPLFFYANDQIWDFIKYAEPIVNKSSSLIVGINFANGTLPKCDWLARSNKLKAVIFQNEEKRSEFDRDAIGLNGTRRVVMFGAIDLNKYLEVYCKPREDKDELVVVKHGLPDWRKYVTKQSEGTGDKIHVWQQKFVKENDMVFYERMLKDIKDVRFEFMEAHPEIIKYFKDEPRMKFYKFNEISVEEFLSHGHVYLHRMSNAWRDQYPRVVAEALAAGIPIISEPRDGTKDRIIHGNTGFYAVHYDEFLLHIKTLKRKEGLRRKMGQAAKDWARLNLDPRKWVEVIEDVAI
jgi:glycosyltransferase involved in cell wall biosynthesis